MSHIDTPTPSVIRIGCEDNRELLASISSLIKEAHDNLLGLEHTYQAVQSLTTKAHSVVGRSLLNDELIYIKRLSEYVSNITSILET